MAGANPTLNVIVREKTGKGSARQLRQNHQLPGVCYGPDIESFPVAVDAEHFEDVLEAGGGRNTVFQIETDNGQVFEHAMLKDYQFHPVNREVTHLDLMVVDSDRSIEVDVPLEPHGEPEGVHMGGKLQVMRPTVPVACTPATIPEVIEVDVSALTPGDTISAWDLEYPEGTEAAAEHDYAIFRIMMPREGVVGLEPTGPEAEEEEGEEVEGEELEGEEAEGEEEGAEAEGGAPGASPPGA